MNSERIAKLKEEMNTVGMLPNEGDNNYSWDKCEYCGEETETQTWEGCELSVTICPNCMVKIGL